MNSCLNPGPDSPMGKKQASEANREVIWGGERVATAGRPPGSLCSPIFFVFDPVFLPFDPTAETGPRLKSGAPNGGFLPNALKTLFQTIQSTLRPLQMHSKRCYKISICSVFLLENLIRFFKIAKASILFSRKFLMQFSALRKRKSL